MQKILDGVGEHAPLHEILANYEQYKSITEPSQFAVIQAEPTQYNGVALAAHDILALHEAGLYPTIVHGVNKQHLVSEALASYERGYSLKGFDTILNHGAMEAGGGLNKEVKNLVGPYNPAIANYITPGWGVLAGTLSHPDKPNSVDELHVDTAPILTVMGQKAIPIVSTIGKLLAKGEDFEPGLQTWEPHYFPGSSDGFQIIDIKPHKAALAIATALGVGTLVICTEAGGVLDKEEQVIGELGVEDITNKIYPDTPAFDNTHWISQSIVVAVKQALNQGVENVSVTSPVNLLSHLFSTKGKGTVIK